MKKIVFVAMVLGMLFFVVQPTLAGTYRNPTYPYDWGYKAGDCIMVNTRAEADATHVYTLNPENTVLLNQSYYTYWQRNASCAELQFQVDHNTTISRLNSWLRSVQISRYQNMAASQYEGQSVSTNRHEWYFIQNGVAHRIYDWLTGLSWGLLLGDRLSIPNYNTPEFYQYVTFGKPLQFSEGQYADEITDIWQNGNRDFSSLPTRLQEELTDHKTIFLDACTYDPGGPGSPYAQLLDFDWMAYSPGCPLAD